MWYIHGEDMAPGLVGPFPSIQAALEHLGFQKVRGDAAAATSSIMHERDAKKTWSWHNNLCTVEEDILVRHPNLENLDGMEYDDLVAWVQTNEKVAHKLQLEYANCKLRAIQKRQAGDIKNAMIWERTCDSLHKQLPDYLKW